MVKWGGKFSDKFKIKQGERQGGILSTDMYKVYDNKLLDCLESVMLDIRIGGINCNGPMCADDTTVVTEERGPLQTLLSISDNYRGLEQYLLQLLKSVMLTIAPPRKRDKSDDGHPWTLKDKEIPDVTHTMHIGIMRSADTEQTATTDNIQKTRRKHYIACIHPASMERMI